ncbi:MAG: DUF4920 domain-containing protein [Chitinophagales bacterium]|jgi:hypothetical protein|nr:DUF4920 domain-containing protein [Chitinophagales bacterium]MCC7055888.1 DUF4920 domain-containing protein [Chitinophagales bacterium]HMS50883.1 DUF4920 domain-containing protein [Chitinophagales bacterium]
MKQNFFFFMLFMAVFAFAALQTACGGGGQKGQHEHADGHDHSHDGHDHEGHDHDHGDASEAKMNADGSPTNFGAKIDETGAVSLAQAFDALKKSGKGEINIKTTGEVTEVCQKKGCWMNLKTADGGDMRVHFKDYGFFMPKDIQGRTAVINGIARFDTTSVADLQHYAEDAGKSAEEIAKITEPEIEISFEADGVIVK